MAFERLDQVGNCLGYQKGAFLSSCLLSLSSLSPECWTPFLSLVHVEGYDLWVLPLLHSILKYYGIILFAFALFICICPPNQGMCPYLSELTKKFGPHFWQAQACFLPATDLILPLLKFPSHSTAFLSPQLPQDHISQLHIVPHCMLATNGKLWISFLYWPWRTSLHVQYHFNYS